MTKTVAGVVLSDENGRYLLVQERKKDVYGLWNLPAGHVDEGETLQQAAAREAEEETGFKVAITNPDPLSVYYNESTKTRLNSFRAEITGGGIKVQKSELLDVRWFTYDEILELEKADQLRTPWVKESIMVIRDENNRD